MDKIVYIFGTGRNAATRVLRKAAAPRELQVRVGPWIIRPSRRTPVNVEQLAKYERECIEKVEAGTVQIQNGDTVVYSLEAIKQGFAALREDPESGLNYMTMPYGELMELMRGESPNQEVWDAFVERSLNPAPSDATDLPDMETRIRRLTDFAEANSAKFDTLKSLQTINAARVKLAAEKDETEATRQAEREALEASEAERALQEEAQSLEAGPPDDEIVDEPVSDEGGQDDASAETEVDEEQMGDPNVEDEALASDETGEEPATESSEEPSDEEAVEETETNTRDAREAQLPEGWRTFTNAKLAELLGTLNVELPEKHNKASFVNAVEAWLGGN